MGFDVLDEIGCTIQDIVDKAVRESDYSEMTRTINETIQRGLNAGKGAVRGWTEGADKPRKKDLYYTGSWEKIRGYLKVVGGAALGAFGAILALAGLLISSFSSGGFLGGIGSLMSLILFLGGAALVGFGLKDVVFFDRFKTVVKNLKDQTYIDLNKLAKAMNRPVKKLRADIKKMLALGWFKEGHLDALETTLITSNETFAQYEAAQGELERRRREEESRAAASGSSNEQVQAVLDQGREFIRQIHACNDAIPGEEMSEKISRMEMLVARIFERAKSHPEVIPDLKRLMDYYLPTTVKLLKAYADLDAQPVQGENIKTAKREIESSIDTLNSAFEKLLDTIFQDTAWDVSTDISALKAVLAQEGLKESDFDQMRKNPSADLWKAQAGQGGSVSSEKAPGTKAEEAEAPESRKAAEKAQRSQEAPYTPHLTLEPESAETGEGLLMTSGGEE